MSDSLRPHESQHARPPCPSPTPGVYSNSCPLSQWCHYFMANRWGNNGKQWLTLFSWAPKSLQMVTAVMKLKDTYSLGEKLWPTFSSVQWLSHVWLFVTPWNAAFQASLSITTSQSLLRLMSIKSVMPSNHLILCRPLLLLPSIFPSIRVFSNESVLRIGWPKYWSFSFILSPSNKHSGLISYRIDWFDLAVQGMLKSLLQHHSSKTSIL